MNARYKWTEWGAHGERRRTSIATWRNPTKWNADAPRFQREHGRRQRVFCASLADVFDNQVPKEWRADLFALIRACPDLDWQLLTKRPQNIAKMLPDDWGKGYRNVWLGTTTEDQAAYDQRWRVLERIPAAVRFVSYEPAISDLVIMSRLNISPDWLIVGAESGPAARDMPLEWPRKIVFQCAAMGVACFVKQLSGRAGHAIKDMADFPTDLRVQQFPLSRAPARFAAEAAYVPA